MNRIEIKPGQKFNFFTVIQEALTRTLPSGQPNRFVLCECKCGNKKEVRLLHLVRGRSKSCGCMTNNKGGESQTELCKVWRQMKNRCSPKYKERKFYFDKGIKVCSEWLNWNCFKKWALDSGYKKGLQIDRKNNSKGYYPSNCRFVAPVVNVNNRDYTHYVNYNKHKIAFMPLLRMLGKEKDADAIRGRIRRGWVDQIAIDTPIKYKHTFC